VPSIYYALVLLLKILQFGCVILIVFITFHCEASVGRIEILMGFEHWCYSEILFKVIRSEKINLIYDQLIKCYVTCCVLWNEM